MKNPLVFVFCLLVTFTLSLSLEIVVTIPFSSNSDVAWCTEQGYGVDYIDSQIVRMVVTPAQLEELRASGHRVTVIIPDLAAHERKILGWDNKNPNSPPGYDTYDDIINKMTELANTYPTLCQLKTLGTTWNGNTIYALKISKDVDTENFEPELRLVGAHHGNENISAEVCLYWTTDLLQNYGSDADATYIVDHYELWSQPVVNPDGYIATTRTNAHGIDLNRNYSYMWDPSQGSQGPYPFSEPETQAVRDYSIWNGITDTNNFVASLTYHSGATCCNTVWNYSDADHPSGTYHPTNDDALVMQWGGIYTSNCPQPGFYLTNGCDWYATFGDLNDWSYGERGDFDYTIEVYSAGYNPPPSNIQTIYDYHKTSMTLFFRDVDKYGVFGKVARTDMNGTQPLAAKIFAEAPPDYLGWYTYNDPKVWGDYYRPLKPGTYTVTCEPQPAGVFPPVSIPGVVVNNGVRTRLDFCFPYSIGVNLTNFTANPNPRGIQLTWSVVGSVGSVSYNIYRRPAGVYKDKTHGFTKLNGAPITGGTNLNFLDSQVRPETRYEYGLGIVDNNGVEVHHGPVVGTWNDLQLAFRLYANAPNPFTSATQLRFDLSQTGHVNLRIYDLTGRLVRILTSTDMTTGSYSLTWDGHDAAGRECSAGVYTAILSDNSQKTSLKMVKANR